MPTGWLRPHKGDGDAGKAKARREIQRDFALIAHNGIDRHQTRKRAGDAHGSDDHTGHGDARVLRRRFALSHRAQGVAPAGSPDQ